MPELWELTRLIRSKNAGPFELTFDIMFDNPGSYKQVCESGVLTRSAAAKLFHLPEEQVRYFKYDDALAIKISIPRLAFSGDVADTDIFGGQFHSPLVGLHVPGSVTSAEGTKPLTASEGEHDA